ncbi:MAG: hypothetical protein WC498_01070 [Candidatus Saccharimonadales bacterium]
MKTSVRNNERGFGVVPILVILAVLAVVGGAGWYVMNKNKSTTTSSTNKAVTNAVKDECNKLYNDKDLCKFASNFTLEGVSYKAVFSTSQGTAGSSSTTTLLADGKGGTHMITASAGAQTEFIVLGGASYMKNADSGVWLKFGSSSQAATKPTNPTSDIKFETKLTAGETQPATTYKKIGKEACGSLTCFKYTVVESAQAGTSSIWFDTKDYRLQRMSSTDTNGTTSDATFTYQAVNITTPSPVQDFSSASGLPAGQ